MYPIAESLEVADKNKIASYLPVRNKGNDFEWGTITGMLLAHAMRKSVHQYGLADFQRECRDHLSASLDAPEFWDVLDRMYFGSGAIYQVSPEFLIFKASGACAEANKRMASLFQALLESDTLKADLQEDLNFVERELLAVLHRRLGKGHCDEPKLGEAPYLPYLAAAFQADLAFLATHPKYLLQELTNALRLYAFCYCTQLALNIRDWKFGEPRPKPLFFILDTEKASNERAMKQYGYDSYFKSSEYLFPYLSALESLQLKEQKRPLWKLYQDVKAYGEPDRVVAALNVYNLKFSEKRELPAPRKAADLEEAFGQLLEMAFAQFREGATRHSINRKYMLELRDEVCNEFIQSRGRAGRVLVLNQDQLLLLTNLAIGERERLRLHELLEEFKRRGIYLDNQSALALVGFFERLGNVERMSDSGDAIYVRKTV